MEVIEPLKNTRSDLAHDLFAHAPKTHLADPPRDTVEASTLSVFHQETYFRSSPDLSFCSTRLLVAVGKSSACPISNKRTIKRRDILMSALAQALIFM